MDEGEAQDLLMRKYGFLKGCRLLAYLSALYALGPEEFDRRSSQPQRSLIQKEARLAGVDPERIRWGALTRTQRRLREMRDESVRRQAERESRARARRAAREA